MNTVNNTETNIFVWEYDSVNGNDIINKYNTVGSPNLPKSPNPPNVKIGDIWFSRNMTGKEC